MKNSNTCFTHCYLLWLTGCKKEITVIPLPDIETIPDTAIIRIPVVVHVIYNEDLYNISDEKIRSQIDVLNQDYRKRNADQFLTPPAFVNIMADACIEFVLAKTDPDGNASNGIIRTQSDVDGWDGRTAGNMDKPLESLKLYQTKKGGQDAWPADRYLNIWVAKLSERNGRVGLAGYAQLPGGNIVTDGVVIDPRCFGTVPPLNPGNHLGRTATHEIGHWLNLNHVFDQPSDMVDDTPVQMRANFMDYEPDNETCMFTLGQKKRMRDVFAGNGPRNGLYRNIKG